MLICGISYASTCIRVFELSDLNEKVLCFDKKSCWDSENKIPNYLKMVFK